jgi:hypothetical protein
MHPPDPEPSQRKCREAQHVTLSLILTLSLAVPALSQSGADAVRYFMLNEIAFGTDGDFSDRKLIDCFNAKQV